MQRMIVLVSAVVAACGGGNSDPINGNMIDPGPSCSELGASTETCFDFNEGTASEWTPEAGDWIVSNGAYIGFAQTLDGAICQASSMVTSRLNGVVARNVRISLDMTAFDRPDKFVVLRGLDANNRIEINLRARFTDDSAGDVVVQEISDCTQILHTQWFEVDLPHELEQPLHAEITLIDNNLTVMVDGQMVLSRDFTFPDRAGYVGLGVIEGGTVVFDSFVLEVLDPTP